MKSRFRTHSLKHLCTLAMGLLLLTSAAIAQNDWQMAYDPASNNKNASARGGIVYLPNNKGTVTAGEMQIPNTTTDIYIIKHDACGYPMWQKSYEIGNIDSCRKIRAVPNDPAKGFIVVGTTQHYFPPTDPLPECTYRNNLNQIFLMKIDSLGEVQWVKTYGGTGSEQGNDVQVIPGGFIVAGMAPSGLGHSDGLIMRTDLNGNVGIGFPGTWIKRYGGPQNDYFHSCTIAANGDIIATGGTLSYSKGSTDVFLTRVLQISGLLGGLGFISNYGTTSPDVGWSVVECSNGKIAVCGYTAWSGTDGLILMTDPSGGFPVSHYYGGGGGGGQDEFREIIELNNASRDLMVTGFSHQPVGGFGDYDVYVGQVDRNTLVPVKTLLFGGPFSDQGWAITRDPLSSGTGFQVAGFSYRLHSLTPGNLDVYVISRPNMNTRGCDVTLHPVHGTATLSSTVGSSYYIASDFDIPTCSLNVIAIPQSYFESLCGECSPTRTMPDDAPSIGEWRASGTEDRLNPAYAADQNVSSVDQSADASAALYPNPVRSGNSFTLALPNGSSGVEIMVTDMSGKMIHTRTASGSEVMIDTDGWDSGVHAIRLSWDGKTATRQIVVTE